MGTPLKITIYFYYSQIIISLLYKFIHIRSRRLSILNYSNIINNSRLAHAMRALFVNISKGFGLIKFVDGPTYRQTNWQHDKMSKNICNNCHS